MTWQEVASAAHVLTHASNLVRPGHIAGKQALQVGACAWFYGHPITTSADLMQASLARKVGQLQPDAVCIFNL